MCQKTPAKLATAKAPYKNEDKPIFTIDATAYNHSQCATNQSAKARLRRGLL